MTAGLPSSLLCAVLVVVGTAPMAAMGADWPVFRGNAQQTGVAAAALPDRLRVLWTFKAKDAVESTAALAGATAYVGSMDEHLYALDLRTGALRWSAKMGAIKAAVAYRGGAVYAGDADGGFYCLDAQTGSQKWKFEAPAEATSGANFVGDNILFGCGDEHLYCLGADGKLRWKFKVAGGPVLGSPAFAAGHTFVSGCDSTLHVLDLATGRAVRGVELDGQTASTPAVAGDELYLGTMSNQVVAINWQKGEVAWRFETPRRPKAFYGSAAVSESVIVCGSRDKNVYGLDRRTGKEIWRFATQGNVDSSPVIAAGRVYAASLDGTLYVLDLSRGTEWARSRLGSGVIASPAVADGRLVIGTEDGVVHCLGADGE